MAQGHGLPGQAAGCRIRGGIRKDAPPFNAALRQGAGHISYLLRPFVMLPYHKVKGRSSKSWTRVLSRMPARANSRAHRRPHVRALRFHDEPRSLVRHEFCLGCNKCGGPTRRCSSDATGNRGGCSINFIQRNRLEISDPGLGGRDSSHPFRSRHATRCRSGPRFRTTRPCGGSQ